MQATFIVDRVERGIVARYGRINKYTGWKGYEEQDEAEDNFRKQSLCYSNGIAPRCWNLTKGVLNGLTLWGFYTQHVKVAYDKLCKIPGAFDLYDEQILGKNRIVDEIITKTLDIEGICYKIGIVPCDFHPKNVGWCGKNFVAIDFSECRWENERILRYR